MRNALSLLTQPEWQDLSRARIEPVTEGMSGALLFRVTENGQPGRYLKIAREEMMASLRNEIARTRWLASQGIRVPPILRVEERGDELAILTGGLPGAPADDNPLAEDLLVDAMARAMAALHRLSPAACPFDESLAVRLATATKAVATDDVDPEYFDPRNHGVAPAVLLERLMADPPREDFVVAHGDASLANLIVDADGRVGFVDCGNAGRGDRYLDLAVLAGEIEATFGAAATARFIRAYGLVTWDAAKARYFSDLYELF
jgi:aminoglycoside 3'-phosphotransferase II